MPPEFGVEMVQPKDPNMEPEGGGGPREQQKSGEEPRDPKMGKGKRDQGPVTSNVKKKMQKGGK